MSWNLKNPSNINETFTFDNVNGEYASLTIPIA